MMIEEKTKVSETVFVVVQILRFATSYNSFIYVKLSNCTHANMHLLYMCVYMFVCTQHHVGECGREVRGVQRETGRLRPSLPAEVSD